MRSEDERRANLAEVHRLRHRVEEIAGERALFAAKEALLDALAKIRRLADGCFFGRPDDDGRDAGCQSVRSWRRSSSWIPNSQSAISAR